MKRSATWRGLVRPALLVLVTLGFAGSLAAQDGPQIPPPRVAVFPFMDPLDAPERMLGRRASDAVWHALAAQSPWEVVDQGFVLRLCESEDVAAPFAVGHLQMLAGHRASAALAITGAVEAFTLNHDRGIAQVTVQARLVETVGGTPLASSRGVSSAKRAEGEVLGQAIDRALIEAGADAVRELTSIDPLVATVVATLPDGRVMMDGPREPAIKPGSKLLISRGGPGGRVAHGAVEVLTSRLTVLHAKPISGEDFRQGDRGVVVAR
ncbi:MAG: hypothetical protein ACOCX2_06055 [Armatimonadota bacterium]